MSPSSDDEEVGTPSIQGGTLGSEDVGEKKLNKAGQEEIILTGDEEEKNKEGEMSTNLGGVLMSGKEEENYKSFSDVLARKTKQNNIPPRSFKRDGMDMKNVNDSWVKFSLFVWDASIGRRVTFHQMNLDNVALIARDALGLNLMDVRSVSCETPYRPEIILMKPQSLGALGERICFPIDVSLSDRKNNTFKARIECREFTDRLTRDRTFNIRMKNAWGSVSYDDVAEHLSPFVEVEGIKVAQPKSIDVINMKNSMLFKQFPHLQKQPSSSLNILVKGTPSNVPSFLPINGNIFQLEFPKAVKQCSNCFEFGHGKTKCVNQPKGPKAYGQWIRNRLERKSNGNTCLFTVNVTEEAEIQREEREHHDEQTKATDNSSYSQSEEISNEQDDNKHQNDVTIEDTPNISSVEDVANGCLSTDHEKDDTSGGTVKRRRVASEGPESKKESQRSRRKKITTDEEKKERSSRNLKKLTKIVPGKNNNPDLEDLIITRSNSAAGRLKTRLNSPLK